MRTLKIVVLALVALAASLPAQEQRIFRGAVQSVPIYTTVVDRQGRLVPDLSEADFAVFDDGKPAAITNFVAELQPLSVVVALDLSGSMVNVIDLVKTAAEAFALRLLPHDRARIVEFHDVTRWGPDFTGDRDAILHYLRTGMQYGNATRLWDALYESVDQLKTETNRRVVVALSDGDDYGSRLGEGDVLRSAQAHNVMIYGVGLRNRYRGGPGGSFVTSQPDRGLRRLAEHTGGGFFLLDRATDLNSTFTRVADELRRQYLLAIPAQTDGRTHRIEVRVRLPGMTARARRTYDAAPAS